MSNPLSALFNLYNARTDKHSQCNHDEGPINNATSQVATQSYCPVPVFEASHEKRKDHSQDVAVSSSAFAKSSNYLVTQEVKASSNLFPEVSADNNQDSASVILNKVPAIVAYGIYKQWMMRRRSLLARPNEVIGETSEMVFYTTALLLVETMVYAMRADGRIDQDHFQSLRDFCQAVFSNHINNVRGEIDNLLTIHLDPYSLASKVRFAEESLDIYLLSAVMLSTHNPLEQSYLEMLSACLGIGPSARRELDRRAMRMLTHDDDLTQGRYVSACASF